MAAKFISVLAIIGVVISFLGYKFRDNLPQPSDGLLFYMETSLIKWQRISEETVAADGFPSNCSSLFVIIHGYTESSARSWIGNLSSALIRADRNSCVMVVDHWNYLSFSRPYMTANIQKIAADIAKFLQILSLKCNINFSSMHIIAFSLAGQIIGAVPAYLSKNQIFGRITGIDTSLPWKPTNDKNAFLDATDAEIVVSLRTSRYGISNPDLDVDFYFNNFDGIQPSCNKWWWPDFVIQICSHNRAVILMIEMIKSEGSIKMGCRCNVTDIVEDCDIRDKNIFGLSIDPRNRGKFCIKTNENPPYLEMI